MKEKKKATYLRFSDRAFKRLRRWIDLSVKMRWLKRIDKEIVKYNKAKNKLNRQLNVINSLVKRYKEIYSEDLRASKKGGAE